MLSLLCSTILDQRTGHVQTHGEDVYLSRKEEHTFPDSVCVLVQMLLDCFETDEVTFRTCNEYACGCISQAVLALNVSSQYA